MYMIPAIIDYEKLKKLRDKNNPLSTSYIPLISKRRL
jgi:hypothetical protein